VTGIDGKPAVGATVAKAMYSRFNPDRTVRDRAWTYSQAVKTGADGTVTVDYDRLAHGIIVRDPERKQTTIRLKANRG
jgi:hypothetical protein